MADLDELAEKGRAVRLAENRENTELRARFEAEQSDEARRAARWRLSPLALNPLRFAFSIPFWVAWLASLAMAFPYFKWFVTGAPVHGSSKTGSKWVLDPTKEGYWLFYPWVILTILVVASIVWKVLAKRGGERAFAAETTWAAGAAVPVIGYPTAVGQDEHRYKIDIYFTGKLPPRDKLADIMRGVDEKLEAEDYGDNCRRFVANYSSDAHPARNAQRFAATFHTVVESVLVPMHADCPIARIEVKG